MNSFLNHDVFTDSHAECRVRVFNAELVQVDGTFYAVLSGGWESAGYDVHYICINSDSDEMFIVDFITKRDKDAMANGYFDDGHFYIFGQQVCGWRSINYLVQALQKS